MKESVNLNYPGEDVKEFFVRASKLYKEANFNGANRGIITEAMQSDLSLLQFAVLRKATTFDEMKETRMEYGEHQKLYSSPNRLTKTLLVY